jgi:hypothetical protein
VVCGAQFLPGSCSHATTCSAACLAWLRLKNKGQEEHRRVGDLADAMMQEFQRVIAEKTRS